MSDPSEAAVDLSDEVRPLEDVEGRATTGGFVSWQATRLQSGYTRYPQSARSRAELAQLRRAVGRPIGTVPEALPLLVNPWAPPTRGEKPTWDEIAIHTALPLFALHQQSQDRPVHRHGTSFSTALGRLRFTDGQENPGVVRRFQALGVASSFGEIAAHARALITLLRGAGGAFDYGRFADDLVGLQSPHRADHVRLSWGRDFYRVLSSSVSTEEQP